ncbi:MAG: hypothetical protein AB7O73_12230 [Bacteroidia bacterium]
MSKHLLEFVESFTPSEKRYINLNLKTFSFDEEANVMLTDFNKLEHYTSLKRKHEITIKSNKTRLYYKLLDVLFGLYKLQIYDNERDNRIIKRSQILFFKGFYKEGVKNLEKVIYREEAFSYLLQIEAIELRIKAAIKFVDIDYLKTRFEKDKKLLNKYSKLYFNYLEYESIWTIIKLESTTNYFYGDDNETVSKHLRLLDNENKALSLSAKAYFYQINGFLAMKSGKLREAEAHMNKLKELFDDNVDLKNNRYGEYLKALRNICIVKTQRETYEEIDSYISFIKEEIENDKKAKSLSYRGEVFVFTEIIRLNNIVTHGKILENAELIGKLAGSYKIHSRYLSGDENSTMAIMLSLSYFVFGNFRYALRYCNQTIGFAKESRNDLYHLGLILELCVHIRLENEEVFLSKVKAYKRILHNKGSFFSFESDLIKQLENLENSPNDAKLIFDIQSFVLDGLMKDRKVLYKPFMCVFYL